MTPENNPENSDFFEVDNDREGIKYPGQPEKYTTYEQIDKALKKCFREIANTRCRLVDLTSLRQAVISEQRTSKDVLQENTANNRAKLKLLSKELKIASQIKLNTESLISYYTEDTEISKENILVIIDICINIQSNITIIDFFQRLKAERRKLIENTNARMDQAINEDLTKKIEELELENIILENEIKIIKQRYEKNEK